MSDIHIFNNADNAPKPRDQIKIERVAATAYPDRFRVHIEVAVTPFLERPNLLLVLKDAENRTVSELNVVETMHATMEFTMHIRNVDEPAGDYTLQIELFYDTRNPPQDRASFDFAIPEEA